PVHSRHDQIGDDDGRTERGDFFERLFAVARRLGKKAPALDELLEAHARGGIVLDDQDALGCDFRFFVNDINSVSRRCRHASPRTMSFLHSGPRTRLMQAQLYWLSRPQQLAEYLHPNPSL